jgi:cytidylate kinase
MIVTIDGPAGAGKSTVARGLADRLGWRYLDTGAMYRAVAWAALERGIDLDDPQAIAALARRLAIVVEGSRVTADGIDISDAIRVPSVTEATRKVADATEVRAVMVDQQQRLGRQGSLVTEGRDQGTVVFPGAELKIFLTASPAERASRRHREQAARGAVVTLADVLESQIRRDSLDAARDVGPLKPAADAVLLETDGLSAAEVISRLADLVAQRVPGELAQETSPRNQDLPAAGDTPRPGSKRPVTGSNGDVSLFGRLFYGFLWVFSRTLAVSVLGFRCRFAERIPSTGGLLVLSSHQSHLDPLLLGLACNRRLASLARSSLYTGPIGTMITALGAIPIDREAPSVSSMRTVISALKRGVAVVVFPEGTRSPDGRLGRLKGGFAVLARRSGAPILPVAIVGAWECWPKGSSLPGPGRVRLEFGRLIRPDEVARLDDASLLAACQQRLDDLDATARSLRSGTTGSRRQDDRSALPDGQAGEKR